MASESARIATLAIYYVVLALLAMYGTHRAMMVWLYYRHRRDVPRPAGDLPVLPRVTIQLPIYNEVYVVERLIEAVAAIDYPKELLEIQVLDDSTDETCEIASQTIARCRERRFPADLRRRLRAAAGHPERSPSAFRGSGSRNGPGPLGALEPRLLPADADSG